MKATKCPICLDGELEAHFEASEIQRNGQTLPVTFEYSICSGCGEEMTMPEQIKRNDCRVRDAWRKADGLLTGSEIKKMRKHLDLTQEEASAVFGGGINAFSKYERSEVIQSTAMDKLMRLAMENDPVYVFQWLMDESGLDTSKKLESYFHRNTTKNLCTISYGKPVPFAVFPRDYNTLVPANDEHVSLEDKYSSLEQVYG